ncbi:hypothetical protein [Streptomyces sp. NPDC056160]|uniref:hypothetical protein n=1 Tax=Streptomyces sp. NPDC056160 TaxID=3345731 RepID=UPI0035DA111F
MHTDKNIRDALDKSVEKLEVAARTAHDETTKEVVDELSRMRANFRDVHNKLNSNGESLNTAVRDAVSQLRTGLREVRFVLADLTPPPASAPVPSPSPSPDLSKASGTEDEEPWFASAPVTTATEPGAPEDTDLHTAAIPAQRTTDEDSSPGPVPGEDTIRQAVREVLIEELAPVLAPLTAPDSPATGQPDTPGQLREAAAEIKEELSTALQEARSALTSLRQKIADLRAGVDELRPRPATTAETAAPDPEVSAEHSALLKTAARVSSASLLCHRDIWEFITAHAGRHPHFRVPPQIADEGAERIRAALSGRSLIALLISLYSIMHTASDGDGDLELAATVYERIDKSLTSLTPSGEAVTITLDDRTTTTPDTSRETRTEDAPENDGAPSASSEQDTDPGEEPGATAA